MTHLAVAIPAFNEAEGIGEFLVELDRELEPVADEVTFVVVDDCSTDATATVLSATASHLRGGLRVLTNATNRQHGPTVWRAYEAALATGAELIAQVDGDGQFRGRDLAMVVRAAGDGDTVLGVRAERVDPWFRKVLTRVLRVVLRVLYGVRLLDANCPLRAFPAPVLRELLADVDAASLIPNVHLSVLVRRSDHPFVELAVDHLDRRSTSAQGTMWGSGPSRLVPPRLVTFAAHAGIETMGLAVRRRRSRVRRRRAPKMSLRRR
jgi:dolichol-phosphate mannosyltransferase